ncbi:MarR family winged helix-turn-helix transcriptional regulator [Dactylosporangium sp. AC04546]|uniref:MarR family winged helix-turn-helix transcriptional regulator n=1 Tax=Dactylosporangium sp. AC04546 TaxID=2862460 RepID=UPI001EE0B372|nr:MarR family winged helix-turn-helix transcriptional regulator [Dactylosporangium sp. AC04546]WVK87685.1 MarR family winged helix-turn-helix transcriptional regulator [Dactylosporangium sp. AC04546]
MSERRQPGPRGVAFLLAQLGAHASERFSQRVEALGLTPPDVGLLRMIAGQPGRSQQSLSVDLGVVPSRVVVLVDSLDHKGLVERRPSETDRRHHALHLTAGGEQVLMEMRSVASVHDDEICAALDPEERSVLTSLLQRIADEQGLVPGVHPGYRQLGTRRKSSGQRPAEGAAAAANAGKDEDAGANVGGARQASHAGGAGQPSPGGGKGGAAGAKRGANA